MLRFIGFQLVLIALGAARVIAASEDSPKQISAGPTIRGRSLDDLIGLILSKSADTSNEVLQQAMAETASINEMQNMRHHQRDGK